MNRGKDSKLEKEIDKLLNEVQFGQTQPNEHDDELIQIARRLATTDLSKRSQIQTSLYQKVSDKSKTQNQGERTMLASHNLKRAAAVLATILLLVIASPAITSFAQTLLAQIGQFTVTNEQEHYPAGNTQTVAEMESTPTPIPVDVRENVQTEPIRNLDGAVATNLSAEAAADIAQFDIVREPSYLPAGYQFNGRIVFADDKSMTVDSYWVGDMIDVNAVFPHIMLSQSAGDKETTLRVGNQARSQEVTIKDLPAMLITNADLDNADGTLYTLLMWEDGDYSYVMISPSLSVNDLIAVAESMYQ